MREVEPLHQSSRAIVLHVPEARYHGRDAGHEKCLRQPAERFVGTIVSKARATTREHDQSSSLRLQIVDLLNLERAVEGYPIGIRSLLSLVGIGMIFSGQHNRGDVRGLLTVQRM